LISGDAHDRPRPGCEDVTPFPLVVTVTLLAAGVALVVGMVRLVMHRSYPHRLLLPGVAAMLLLATLVVGIVASRDIPDSCPARPLR
jgi:hypothetical protein